MDDVDVLFGSKIVLLKSRLCIFMPLTLLNIPSSTSDSLRGHSVHFSHVERSLWSMSQCRPNSSFLSVFRIILTRACLEQNDPYSRHDCPRFLSFQRNLNNHHVFVTIPDISLRKSLIPEVFLDCYCVARKRPIRSEKTMRQTNICQVSTHLEIHFILRSARKSCLFFKNRGRPAWLVQH